MEGYAQLFRPDAPLDEGRRVGVSPSPLWAVAAPMSEEQYDIFVVASEDGTLYYLKVNFM